MPQNLKFMVHKRFSFMRYQGDIREKSRPPSWASPFSRPQSEVVDSRFGIGVKEDLGQWQRSRLEDTADELHVLFCVLGGQEA